MDTTLIFYAYDTHGENVWTGRAQDVIEASKEASLDTGIPRENLSIERA